MKRRASGGVSAPRSTLAWHLLSTKRQILYNTDVKHLSDQIPAKPWYKQWWGVIIAVLLWPLFLPWLIWARSHWHLLGKIAATTGIAVLIVLIYMQLQLLQISSSISHKSSNLRLQTPAYSLAAYDLSYTPDAAALSKYQAMLDELKPFCTEDQEKLAGEIMTSEQDLQKNGVTNKSTLALLGALTNTMNPSAYAYQKDKPRVNCIGGLAGYLELHEPLIRR